MLPKETMVPGLRHFAPSVLAHTFYVTLFICFYFVYNGIEREEANKTQLIHDEYSLITTKSDKRKGNVFFSTPDYFLKLSELVPEVEAIIQGDEVEVSFNDGPVGAEQVVARDAPFYLVGAGFFDAALGRFVQGRGFTREEVFSGKPMVVISTGLLVKLFGDYDQAPATIQIGGIEFQVIGSWAFNSAEVIENQAVFLPIGLHQLLGKSQSTYINNFILRGDTSAILSRLKLAIDSIQIDAGHTPVRPEFSIVRPKHSRQFDQVSSQNKVYVDVLIWLAFLAYVFLAWRDSSTWLTYSQRWAGITFMAKGNTAGVVKQGMELWWFVQSVSIALALGIALAILGILRWIYDYTLSEGPTFHVSIFLYLLSVLLLTFLVQRRAKSLSFTFK